MAFAPVLPLSPCPPSQRVAALSHRQGGGVPAAFPFPGAIPTAAPHSGITTASRGGRHRCAVHMAAPRFDGADFGDAAFTGGAAPEAARRGAADTMDAQRVQLVRILLRLINLPRQGEKVRALIEALEAAPAAPLPAVAVAGATASPVSPVPPQRSLPSPLGHPEADATHASGAPGGGGPFQSSPPARLASIARPLSAAEAALHAALDGGRPWRLLFSSTTLGTPSSAVRLRRLGTRFYAPPRLAVNFAEWSVVAPGGVEYTGLFLIISRYTVVSPASSSRRAAVLRLTFLEHQLRPTGGPRSGSRVPPRPDRLVAALTRMLPAEFFTPSERVDISHLAVGEETPLMVTRSKGRRFAGVANVWARDAATAAAGGDAADEATKLIDQAIARVTGWLPPPGPANGPGQSSR
ncbi:hypothetical protein MMPV_004017 [Pyropia vietnamensis]